MWRTILLGRVFSCCELESSPDCPAHNDKRGGRDSIKQRSPILDFVQTGELDPPQESQLSRTNIAIRRPPSKLTFLLWNRNERPRLDPFALWRRRRTKASIIAKRQKISCEVWSLFCYSSSQTVMLRLCLMYYAVVIRVALKCLFRVHVRRWGRHYLDIAQLS